MRRLLRRAHLVATALVGLQLVVWTATGLAFTLFDFEEVRGARERAPASALDVARVAITPAAAAETARAARAPAGAPTAITLRSLAGDPIWIVELDGGEPVLVDASSGARVAVDAVRARTIAAAAYRGGAVVADVTLVESEDDAPGVSVPAYRVDFADRKGTRVFVRATTGEIVSFQNDAYRAFDALFSLHVMGYLRRRDPAQAPLRVASALALVAAVSGAGLFAARLRRRLSARAERPSPAPSPVTT